jgi:hypothetical protein
MESLLPKNMTINVVPIILWFGHYYILDDDAPIFAGLAGNPICNNL